MKLTNLRQLSLVDNGRNTANIHVSNSTCLTKLAILAKTLDSNVMHEISNKLPNLESLLVDEDAREGFDWSWLKNMTNLKYLDYRPQNTTNEVIKFIGALKKLNVLKFGTSYSHQPANFAPLGALTNLESLYIQMHTSHKNQNESFIGNLINLKILKIMVGPLSGFSDLGLLKNLKELQLDICNASQIMQINRLDNLKSLSIGGPDLKDFPWRRLKLNSLEKLEVKSDVFECKYCIIDTISRHPNFVAHSTYFLKRKIYHIIFLKFCDNSNDNLFSYSVALVAVFIRSFNPTAKRCIRERISTIIQTHTVKISSFPQRRLARR